MGHGAWRMGHGHGMGGAFRIANSGIKGFSVQMSESLFLFPDTRNLTPETLIKSAIRNPSGLS